MKSNWTTTLLGKLKSKTIFAEHDDVINNLADAVAEIRGNVPSSVNDLTDYVAGGSGNANITAASITDASPIGRNVITAPDAAAVRTAIGSGTSNLTLGSTGSTAKAGNYAPSSADITDASTIGRGILTATDAIAVRTAIGAGTSNLALGTTNTTAKAGDYVPTIADVTGLQSVLNAKGTVKTVNGTSPDGAGNVTVAAGGTGDISWYSERATSTCETVPYGFQLAGGTLTNGSIFAGLTTNKAAKTYTGARFHLISQTTAPTDLFLGVWAMDGTLLAATGNLTLTVGALNGGSFTTPISLTAGQQVYVGIACIGGSAVSIARYNYAGNVTGTSTAMATLYPTRIEWYVTGNAATSAAPPALTGTTTNALIPWIMLY